MTEDEQERLLTQFQHLCATDAEAWFCAYALIKGLDGKLIRAPKPNAMQRKLFAHYRECLAKGIPCLILNLKPRQRGSSTWAQAVAYHHKRRFPNLKGSLMGNKEATSDVVFELFKRYAENDLFEWPDGLPNLTPISDGNLSDWIILPNGSRYVKETAGSKSAGRGGTIQCCSMTEVAWFEDKSGNDPTLSYLNSFYTESPQSLGIAESTPNGPRGWFYDMCSKKSSSWKLIFTAWYEFEDAVVPFSCDEERAEFMANLRTDERDELARFNDNGLITPEKLNWRRKTIEDKCQGDIDKYRQEYPSDPEECFLKSARPKFNLSVVKSMRAAAEGVRQQVGGMSVNLEAKTANFMPDPAGATLIYEDPRKGCAYLVSIDSMTGEDQVSGSETADPDYHSVQVWRDEYREPNGTHYLPRLVAKHHSRIDTDLLADEAFGLSLHYGNALIVPEVNNCGLHIVKRLQGHGANLYKRRTVNITENKVDTHLGWKTDASTRKTIIDNLTTKIREGALDIPSVELLDEMKSFVVNRNGKPEAMKGKHDDEVLSAAIGVYNLSQATPYEGRTRQYEDIETRDNFVGGFRNVADYDEE